MFHERMVDVDRKTNMKISSDIPNKSPRLSVKSEIPIPPPSTVRAAELLPASDSACSAYEHYVKLPELKNLWESKEFPGWSSEPMLKPALQGLEITFRFISSALFDTRPYANRREWKKRLERLAITQVEIIAALCEEDETGCTAPIILENRVSEESLLPRLATWKKNRGCSF